MPNLKNEFTFIDLFAGCGGLSLGLEQAGFFPLYVNELNKDALETYLINREKNYPHLRDKRFFSRDIKDIVSDKSQFDRLFEEMEKEFNRDFRSQPVDLVVGGPPCQGYSGIGVRRSYSVEKNQLPLNRLYQDMSFFISIIKPRIFLFENVEGLLRSRWTKAGKKGEIFSDVLKTFQEIPNYSVKYNLVYAKDYGVPQNRPRILLVGIRDNVDLHNNDKKGAFTEVSLPFPSSEYPDLGLDAIKGGYLPLPTNKYPDIENVLSDLVDEEFEYGGKTEFYKTDPLHPWQKKIRENPDSGSSFMKNDPLTEQEYSKHSERVVKRFNYMINNKDGRIPDELRTKKFSQRRLPEKWGEKGPNITTCSLPDDFVHYSQARSLTVREWARLQTFPDWYRFAGKRTTGGIRRAGNPRESVFDR